MDLQIKRIDWDISKYGDNGLAQDNNVETPEVLIRVF
jgi:hypothetical protein